jgi:[acyl-carrier-protein] S-malonyltransferase
MSGPVAILCSGQGGQHREMFHLVGEVPAAAPVFEAAARLLGGTDPRRFVHEAEEDALFANRAGQILCCTQALAAWAMLGDARPSSVVLAGYSVGELAAWGCAGLFDPAQTLRLAAERALAMDRASPAGAGLTAIVGLRRDTLDALLRTHALALAPLAVAPPGIAIVNGADSFVVGGAAEALDTCLAEARRLGATRTVRLRVSVPSHTKLLQQAGEAFGALLDRQALHPQAAGIRLLSGIDAETIRDPRTGLRKLALQVARTIDWAGCLEACREAGATRFLELGPGSALARMVDTRMSPAARAVEQFRTADGVRAWLAQQP